LRRAGPHKRGERTGTIGAKVKMLREMPDGRQLAENVVIHRFEAVFSHAGDDV
jgi:hypothetical protein